MASEALLCALLKTIRVVPQSEPLRLKFLAAQPLVLNSTENVCEDYAGPVATMVLGQYVEKVEIRSRGLQDISPPPPPPPYLLSKILCRALNSPNTFFKFPSQEYNGLCMPFSVPVVQKFYEPCILAMRGNRSPICMTLPHGDGISVRDALTPEKVMHIEDANEPAIAQARDSYITVFINVNGWPGYAEGSSLERFAMASQSGYITRATLVNRVAKQIAMLLSKCSKMPCDRRYARYQISQGRKSGVTVDNVYLKGIYNTFEGIWQVDMDIYV